MSKRKRARKPHYTPVQEEMCSTCPFRPGVPRKYAEVRGHIAFSALTEAARICHQTGRDNLFHANTHKPIKLCRGARDLQLGLFVAIGFLKEPTDAAWDAKRKEEGV